MTLLEILLAEVKAAEAKAIKAPWEEREHSHGGVGSSPGRTYAKDIVGNVQYRNGKPWASTEICTTRDWHGGKQDTLDFILKSRTYVPTMARVIEAGNPVIEAARCIRHWHDTGRDNEGMVVSSEHVRKLWDALEAYDQAIAAALAGSEGGGE
jgi:hypothetical protein